MHLRILLDILFPPSKDALCVRNTTLSDLRERVRTHAEEGIQTLFIFKDPLIRTVIHEAKFENNTRAQRLLGAILREHIPKDAYLIPIPLSKKRYRERGYNQVSRIARYTGHTMHEILIRTKHTVPQTDLSRAKRLENVHGVFRLKGVVPDGMPILLDDVTTTGATLRAAQDALGIPVICIALAH